MKNRLRFVSIILTVLTVVLLLVSCSSNKNGKVSNSSEDKTSKVTKTSEEKVKKKTNKSIIEVDK